MRKFIYYISLLIVFLSIPYSYYLGLDIGVSIKYETDFNKCISEVSGIDLCFWLDFYLMLFYSLILLFIILLFFRKPILKAKKNELIQS